VVRTSSYTLIIWSVRTVFSKRINVFLDVATMFATYIPCVISWFGNKTLSSVEFNFNFRTTSDPAGNCIEILPKLNIIGI